MNMLASLATSSDIADEKDSLGGRQLFDTGIYKFTVDLAYIKPADSGAMGLHLVLKTDDKRELRQTFYLTSGKDKGQKNYYEKDGEKKYLPGFNIGNSLSLLTTGKELSQLEPEEKVFNLYDSAAKAEVPTKVPALTEIMGKEIYAAVFRQIVDKSEKDATGKYVPTGETREENEIDKFFCAAVEEFDKLTSAEIKAKRAGQVSEKLFYDGWQDKNGGTIRNKASKGGGTTGAPGAAKPAAASSKPSTSLFG